MLLYVKRNFEDVIKDLNLWEILLVRACLVALMERICLKCGKSGFNSVIWSSNTLATWCEELTHWKRPWCWERLRAGGEGATELVGWRHCLNGHGFGWTLGVGDGQGGLACCSSWGHKESDMTEWLNWTEMIRFPSLFSLYLSLYVTLRFDIPMNFTWQNKDEYTKQPKLTCQKKMRQLHGESEYI